MVAACCCPNLWEINMQTIFRIMIILACTGHTHIQYTCCKHRKQFSVHHDTLWLKWEEGRMEPGIPSLIAEVMRVHLKTGSSRYIKLKHVVSDHQKPKTSKSIRNRKEMPRSIRGLDEMNKAFLFLYTWKPAMT